MLRFFRTLRRKLIEEDNVRKYIWYALGEILLVMIGILLALQVNNWNEGRKLRSYTETQLLSLREQLQKEQELINQVETFHAFRYYGIQKVLTLASLDRIGSTDGLSNVELTFKPFLFWDKPIPEEYDREFVNAVFSWTNRFATFTSDRNIVLDLERSGGFTTLNDPDLKDVIQRYFQSIDFRFDQESQMNNKSIDRWNEILRREGYLSLNPEQIDDPLSLIENDKELAASFRDIGLGALWYGDGAIDIITRNQELIDQINLELGL